MSESLTRRKALGVVAAVPVAIATAGIPAVGLCKSVEEPGKLAALIRHYFAEVDAFNSCPLLHDDEFFHGDQPFDVTLEEIIGVPAQSADDALAAMNWLKHDGEACMIELGGYSLYGQVAESLVNAVRDYLTPLASLKA